MWVLIPQSGCPAWGSVQVARLHVGVDGDPRLVWLVCVGCVGAVELWSVCDGEWNGSEMCVPLSRRCAFEQVARVLELA